MASILPNTTQSPKPPQTPNVPFTAIARWFSVGNGNALWTQTLWAGGLDAPLKWQPAVLAHSPVSVMPQHTSAFGPAPQQIPAKSSALPYPKYSLQIGGEFPCATLQYAGQLSEQAPPAPYSPLHFGSLLFGVVLHSSGH